jgi:hypothetical protein
LFNPFHYVAGGEAMAVGAAILAITSLACISSRTHLDGVLDVHPGSSLPAPSWFYFVEGPLDWLSISAVLLALGKLASRSRVRTIDVFGTQAMARAPYAVLAVVFCVPGLESTTNRGLSALMRQAAGNNPLASVNALDLTVFLTINVLVLAMLVWLIALMYRAFAVSCNLRGGKAVALFIAGLMSAEIVSKLVLSAVYGAANVQ